MVYERYTGEGWEWELKSAVGKLIFTERANATTVAPTKLTLGEVKAMLGALDSAGVLDKLRGSQVVQTGDMPELPKVRDYLKEGDSNGRKS